MVGSVGRDVAADAHRGDRLLAAHAPQLVAACGVGETDQDAGMRVVPSPVGQAIECGPEPVTGEDVLRNEKVLGLTDVAGHRCSVPSRLEPAGTRAGRRLRPVKLARPVSSGQQRSWSLHLAGSPRAGRATGQRNRSSPRGRRGDPSAGHGGSNRDEKATRRASDLGMGNWCVSGSTQTNSPFVPIIDLDLIVA